MFLFVNIDLRVHSDGKSLRNDETKNNFLYEREDLKMSNFMNKLNAMMNTAEAPKTQLLEVRIGDDLICKLTEEMALELGKIALQMDLGTYNTTASAPAPTPAPASSTKSTTSVVYTNDKCYVQYNDSNKTYDLYIETRVPAIRYALKSTARDLGAKFSGDAKKNIFKWTFPSQAKAQEFIDKEKAYKGK